MLLASIRIHRQCKAVSGKDILPRQNVENKPKGDLDKAFKV